MTKFAQSLIITMTTAVPSLRTTAKRSIELVSHPTTNVFAVEVDHLLSQEDMAVDEANEAELREETDMVVVSTIQPKRDF